MKKTRSDSKLDALPENQRDAVERWLCDEGISLKEASARCYADFAVKVSLSSLSEFSSRCQERRVLDGIRASAATANAVTERFKANPANTYEALLAMIGNLAFEQSLKGGETVNVETLSDLANLVLSGRNLKLKEQEVGLKRDRFEFDASKAALKALPALKEIAGNNTLDENAKVNAVRAKLFGQLPEEKR